MFHWMNVVKKTSFVTLLLLLVRRGAVYCLGNSDNLPLQSAFNPAQSLELFDSSDDSDHSSSDENDLLAPSDSTQDVDKPVWTIVSECISGGAVVYTQFDNFHQNLQNGYQQAFTEIVLIVSFDATHKTLSLNYAIVCAVQQCSQCH